MAKERFELSDGVKDLLSGMGKLSAEMKDNSAKAMEYAQSMDKLAKQNTELIKLNEALSSSFSKVSNALNKASNGNDLTKYIKSQEDMVNSINRTYRQYSIQSDTIKKNHLAEELYKQVNALRAVTDNVDLSNLIGNFEEVKKAISSVGSYVKSEFSVSAFKEIKETIEVLEQAGLKIKNVFSTLDKGSKFYDIDRELRETKEQLDLINNTDISELTGKLKKLGEIAEEEFNTFLNFFVQVLKNFLIFSNYSIFCHKKKRRKQDYEKGSFLLHLDRAAGKRNLSNMCFIGCLSNGLLCNKAIMSLFLY